MTDDLAANDPGSVLRQWTTARVAIGRAGASLPTGAHLDFTRDHALARDAVHLPLDVDALADELRSHGFRPMLVSSRAANRSEYLRRPDLGRRLDADSVAALQDKGAAQRLTVVIADGLSALAPARHAVPLLQGIRELLVSWKMDDVVIATQARVALADEIGALRGAEATLILIGERPGLKSPDSLGAYLTYRPRVGRTDAERNCVSNIRPEGLTYDVAAHRLARLLRRARELAGSGTMLKDDSDAPQGISATSSPIE